MKPPGPWRRAWYVGTVVALVAAIAVPSWLAVDVRDRTVAREATEDRVEHVLMYELGPTAPAPRLPLIGTEQALYLGTIARWPADLGPTEPAGYEIEVSIIGAAAPWSRTIALQTRLATDDDVELVAAPRAPLGEERSVLVTLPPVGPGAVVTIRATRGTTLLRVLSVETRRHPDEHEDQLSTDAAASLLRDATIEPWSMLPADERAALVRTLRRKASPLGEDGVNYRAHAVRVRHRATRPPIGEATSPSRGFDVDPDRTYALNVVGPTRLRLDVAARPDALPATTPRRDELGLDVDVLDVETGVHTHHHVDGGGADLDLASGLHGLTFTTGTPGMRVRATAPTDVRVAATPSACDLVGAGGCDLQPDTVRLPIELTGPGLPPLRVRPGVDVATTPPGELVRVVVRALDGLGDGTPMPVDVELQFLDAADQPLGVWRQQLAFVDDPFARYRDASGTTRRSSAPRALTIAAPPTTTHLAVTASAVVAIRFERSLGRDETFAAPYRDHAAGVARWRYAPRASMRWLGFWSEVGRPVLVEQYVEAQVRLDDPEASAPAIGGDQDAIALGLSPTGTPPQRLLREPVAAARQAALRSAWPDGAVAVLPRDLPLRVQVPTAPTSATRVYYEVEPAAVGTAVTIEVDGAAVVQTRFASTRGDLTLPALSPGVHAVTARPAAAALLTINRAPLEADARLQRRRLVYGLDEGPMHVRVRSRAGERVVVNAVVYGPAAIDGWPLRYTIDGGRRRPVPGVVEGQLTATDRRLRVPRAGAGSSAVFVDGSGDVAGQGRTISIPIGPDLGGGTHEIDLYAARGQRLWFRFFVYTYRDASRSPDLQRSVREDDDVAP